MSWILVVAIAVVPMIAFAADPLPQRLEFPHYQALLSRSPFAIATFVPAAATEFAKNLYVASVPCSEEAVLVALASVTDENFKEYLSTKGPSEHRFVIHFSDTQCGNQK